MEWLVNFKYFISKSLFSLIFNNYFYEIYYEHKRCSLVRGRSKPNKLFKAFVDQIRDKLPKATQSCPMEGRITIQNLSMKNKIFLMFPSGFYKLSVIVTDDVDDYVLFVAFDFNF